MSTTPTFQEIQVQHQPEPAQAGNLLADIRHGSAIICYAGPCKGEQAGWVLPGGRRVQSASEAKFAAEQVDRIIRDNTPQQGAAA